MKLELKKELEQMKQETLIKWNAVVSLQIGKRATWKLNSVLNCNLENQGLEKKLSKNTANSDKANNLVT